MAQNGMLFVQGKDRPGIIKVASEILFKAGANLEDVSMTLLEGQFAMMLSFQIKDMRWKTLNQKILLLQKKPWRMNVDLISISPKNRSKKQPSKSIIIAAIGRDRTGLVYQLSSGLAKINANITNLDCRLLPRAKGVNLYSLALEVDLANASDIQKVNRLIKEWRAKLKIEAKLHLSESAIF